MASIWHDGYIMFCECQARGSRNEMGITRGCTQTRSTYYRHTSSILRRKAQKEWGNKTEMCDVTNKPRKQPSSRFETQYLITYMYHRSDLNRVNKLCSFCRRGKLVYNIKSRNRGKKSKYLM